MRTLDIGLIYKLVFQGKIDEIVERVKELTGEERVECELLKEYFLLEYKSTDVKNYLELANKTINDNINNPFLHFIGRLHKVGSFWWTAEFSKGIKELNEIEYQFQQFTASLRQRLYFYEIWFHHLRGTFYHATAEYEKGFIEYSLGLKLIDRNPVFPNTIFRPFINLHTGNGYMKIGEYQKASFYYKKAIDFSLESGNCMSEGTAIYNLALIAFYQGNMQKSLQLHEECLELFQSINYQRGIAENLNRLGLVHHYLENHSKSIEYLDLAIVEAKNTGLVLFIAVTLTNLITVYTNLGDNPKANHYLEQLTILNSPDEDSWLSSLFMQSNFLLSEAQVLKQTNRFKEQVKAQEKLKTIIQEEKFPFPHRVEAILHLTDLLLLELKTFGNEEIFHEVERLSNQAYRMGQKQDLVPVKIETSILKAKLSLIKGELETADLILKDALDLAGRNNLVFLESRIKLEQKQILEELEHWIDLIDQNTPLKERIEHSQIENYLKEAIQIQNLHSGQIE